MVRAIPFSLLLPEDVADYVESIPSGQKAATIVAAIRASRGFKVNEDAKRILVAKKMELQARGISGADMSDAIRSLAARRDQE